MKYTAAFLLTMLTSFCTMAQNPYSAAIKAQADKMQRCLMKQDYNGFASFTYPKIIEMMGGKDSMIAAMTASLTEMEKAGYVITGVEIGEPTSIIKAGKELQCTVPQTLTMKVPTGTLTAKSTLIAISLDSGKSWYFMDTSRKDLPTLQKSIPTLSDKLVIVKYPAPTVTPDK